MLTERDRQSFDDWGFFVLPGLFSAREVDGAREALERLYATAQALPATGDHDGAFFVLSPRAKGPVVVERVCVGRRR